ncbi:testis-expressed protein 52 [Alligator mississippiensis]|nr:testis-expressed protein 52 [Alligator mississippiensis]XP_059582704.1 testis-expressed protein 52 [Alligator mississippiensis]
MNTWVEREFLCKDKHITWPGFSPRPFHRLAIARPPCADTKIKVHQKLRSSWKDASPWHLWGYHTWLDVGRLPPLFPTRPDVPYDSHVWRWITAPSTYWMPHTLVPPPSRMNENTYLKLINEAGVFMDQRQKERAVAQMQKEFLKFEQQKMRTECRAPSLDYMGKTSPPKDIKWYRYIPSGTGLRSRWVPLQPVRPASKDYWDWPCPDLQPHYQDTALRFALRNSSPIYQELVEKYQQLVLPGNRLETLVLPARTQHEQRANTPV